MAKQKRKDFRVPFSAGFPVTTPLGALNVKTFRWNPTGLWIVVGHDRAEIHYSGDKAEDSGLSFDIPADPDFLRRFGQILIDKADELER
ncbi:hypothetical protein [Burkholderia sp. MBR-1]|uniref:hypothetical protein n=1 Tax=Burkholderia sp. MBR-1 TaxID=2732364 RepID=UPI0015EE851C|nr:hypothetical protein [Burkholderia sp. MBR-1]QMI49977.1 hypothetical protein MBR110_31515 [Burkholderia sp. MBR-1]